MDAYANYPKSDHNSNVNLAVSQIHNQGLISTPHIAGASERNHADNQENDR